MRNTCLYLALFLAACGTPGPAFRDIAATRMVMGDSVFEIRIEGLRAEAIRRNPRPAMRLASVGEEAVWAIEAVSGCRVDRLAGDQAQMVAYLDCGSGAPRPPWQMPDLDCEVEELDGETGLAICTPLRPPVWPRRLGG